MSSTKGNIILREYNVPHKNSTRPKQVKNRASHSKKQPPASPVVTLEARRRASLLGNKKMKYVIDRSTNQKHYRDCPRVALIPESDFYMVEDFPGWGFFCWRCTRRAAIREGMEVDIMKHLDAVIMLLGKMKASTNLINEMFCKCGGKIFRIEPNRLFIKIREDSWIIEYSPEGCWLFHNNYYLVDEYTRLISDGYHLQNEQPMAFQFIGNMIMSYSWETHVRRKKEEEIAAKQRELENRLAGITNYMQIPRFSLFNSYIRVADCNNYIERECRRGKLHVNIVIKGCFPKTKCEDALFKVRKRDYKHFLGIVEEAKSYSVRSKNFDYADFCEKKITQPPCTTIES